MKRFLAIIIILCVAFNCSYAQKTRITLEEALLQAGKFRPDSQNSIQWSPVGNRWAYYDTATQKIVIETTSGSKTVINPQDLEKAFGINVGRVPQSFSWATSDAFYINTGRAIYLYNISSKSGKKLIDWDVRADYMTISDSRDAIAYSTGGDVYYKKGDKTTRITTDGDIKGGIINGQSVHRNEFGIAGGIFLSHSGSKVAYYRKDESRVARYPIVNTTTRIATVEDIAYPMAGETSENVTLHIYDTTTGKTIEVKKQGGKEDYLTAITWDPNEKYIYIAELTRDQKHMSFNKFDATSGAYVKTLFKEDNNRWVEPEEAAIFFPSRPGEFFWRSERDGNVHYYRYSTDGQLLGRATDGVVQVERIIGLCGDLFYYVTTADAGMDRCIKFTDLKTGKVGFVHGEKGTWNGYLDPMGRYMVCTFTDLNTPFKVILTQLSKDGRNMGKDIRTTFTAANPMQNHIVGQVKLGRIIKDGREYNTRMVLPSDFDPTRRYPVLLYVYGGPHLQMVRNVFRGGADLWMHHMAERGYVIFTIDGRGTPSRGFGWESAIHRQCGTLEVQDQMIGIDFLKNQSFIYPDRIAVYGWSYGGFTSTSLMLTHPDVFKVAVAGGPVVDWKWYEVMYTERYMDTPQDNPEGFKNASLLGKIKNLKNPLLLIHGTSDPVVVWQHSQELVRAAITEGRQVDYMIYPGHEHNVYGRDRLHLITKVLDYIEKNNQ